MDNPIVLIAWFLALINQLPHPPPTVPTVPTVHRYEIGRATFYSPGLMEKVASRRGIALNGAEGFATYPDCSMLGYVVSVSVLDPRDGEWSGWSDRRIVDCSQPRDYSRHVREGLIELPYQDAVRYGYSTEGSTSVRFYIRRGGDK